VEGDVVMAGKSLHESTEQRNKWEWENKSEISRIC
jgi:hypothetical protein